MLYVHPLPWDTIYKFWEHNNDFKKKIPPSDNILQDIHLLVDHTTYFEHEDKCLVLKENNGYIGCARLLTKYYDGIKVCGLGKFAIKYEYRHKGLSKLLLQECINYMKLNDFDVSILWASVLRVYDVVGYIPIKGNMMIKYFKSVDKGINYWLDSIKTLGTW